MATSRSDHSNHAGLAHDLRILTRRRLFGLVAKTAAGLSLIPVLSSCDNGNASSADAGSADAGTGTGSGDGGTTGVGSCSKIPEETGGPYPGDGTNGANALILSGIVRSDIRASIAGASGVAEGIPLSVTLTLVDSTTCEPLVGHAIYIWHCDREGNYSMYSAAVASENYLRGVQVTDDNGQVTFLTIFPACYSGRWPHIHFEVYPTVTAATSGSGRLATSQLALPKAACDAVFATTGYSASVTNLARVSLATDMVFSDGVTLQIPAIMGSVAAGYTAGLTVAVTA